MNLPIEPAEAPRPELPSDPLPEDLADPRSERLEPAAVAVGRAVVNRLQNVIIVPDEPPLDECPICHGAFNADCHRGKGFLDVAASQDGRVSVDFCPRFKAEMDSRRLRHALADGGLDVETYSKTWRELEMVPEFRVVHRYCEDVAGMAENGVNLILYGEPGFGKTQGGVMLCRAAVAAGLPALAVSWQQFLMQVRGSYHDKSKPSEADQVNALQSAALLFLDDLGAGQGGVDFEGRILNAVISYRYDHRLPTVLSTNLSQKDLGDLMGERAYKRVDARADRIVFKTKCFRQVTDAAPAQAFIARLRGRRGVENP